MLLLDYFYKKFIFTWAIDVNFTQKHMFIFFFSHI